MSPELTEQLFAEFPELFHGRYLPITKNLMGYGFECGDGWYDLILRLATDITTYARQTGLNPLAMQVKQELGLLRFSTDQADAFIHDLCAAAERESGTVCEQCGASGQLRYYRRSLWVRCDEHAPSGSRIAVQQLRFNGDLGMNQGFL